MIKSLIPVLVLLMAACTVNVYDYSTHSGGGTQTDTVYVEQSPPEIGEPHIEPDTVFSRRALIGDGFVETAELGSWARYTLVGCTTETDGVYLELKPVVEAVASSHGEISRQFWFKINCRIQPSMFESQEADPGSPTLGLDTSAGASSALPVVTGNELIALVAGNTTLPFLEEEALLFSSSYLRDGTLSYSAVYSVPEWKMRMVCSEDVLLGVSRNPEFRLQFSDNARRLLQQFYDIFVVHNGEAPVLPVGEVTAGVTAD